MRSIFSEMESNLLGKIQIMPKVLDSSSRSIIPKQNINRFTSGLSIISWANLKPAPKKSMVFALSQPNQMPQSSFIIEFKFGQSSIKAS